MTVSLSPETQKLLEERLHAGQYQSADEVVRAALDALDVLTANGLDEATLQSIDEAENEITNGQAHEWANVREQVRDFFRKK